MASSHVRGMLTGGARGTTSVPSLDSRSLSDSVRGRGTECGGHLGLNGLNLVGLQSGRGRGCLRATRPRAEVEAGFLDAFVAVLSGKIVSDGARYSSKGRTAQRSPRAAADFLYCSRQSFPQNG